MDNFVDLRECGSFCRWECVEVIPETIKRRSLALGASILRFNGDEKNSMLLFSSSRMALDGTPLWRALILCWISFSVEKLNWMVSGAQKKERGQRLPSWCWSML